MNYPSFVALCTNIPKIGDSSDTLKEPPFSTGYVRTVLEEEYADFPRPTGRWNNLLSLVVIDNSIVSYVHLYDKPTDIYPGDHIKVHIYQEEI